jgi:hypothetical protein
MLPIRPMTPAHASIASLSVVLPDDAWPTVAKLRTSPAERAFQKNDLGDLKF